MTNPLYSDNRIKLGVMAFNCSHGSTVTNVDEAWAMSWDDNMALARMVDGAGMEALLPVGRWKGYGGESNFNNRTFETLTWAAAVAAITNYSTIFSTVHAPVIHPVAAAKMAATIDHVSGGRFALNLVAGWYQDEFDMFGVNLAPHDERYDYAAEWLTLVKRLWREEAEFDFNGKYFHGKGLWSEPKPLQQPRPPIMNAGSSATGHAFSAQHADMNFAMLRQKNEDSDREQITQLKRLAADLGRTSQCWIHVYVVCRETEQEARDYLHRYVVEQGDDAAVNNMIRIFGAQSATLSDDVLEAFKFHFKAGFGGYPLIGTPEQIVDGMARLSDMGVDGMLISWVDYLAECRQWIDQVMPLLEQVGLRQPFSGAG
ncbi:MAG: LLM class flavin-dependent oxidoreductase [Rhodospirillaceae bacterium]|nr:LLM class flavin-dependent oxidoreductase [Rhodospirillaceae bacterium]MBT4489996.1 LLM class flavin-dependent oxidoreductase [Rhodospirillaceae bacterium]MBT5191364.1 LLM class flavin-dependent oxidoreductase [Rhodospirillaceae bacterium]MBT5898183.1 LLM class flavin-dependent oxidoreductase [Rhodospirillaceae bacterium]MBT6426864.1 LLM class flavin-dependent oxidoreductase [Rhodospirillaceae bacterium]